MFDSGWNRNTARIWGQVSAAVLIALVFLASVRTVVTSFQESDNPLTQESDNRLTQETTSSAVEEPPAKPAIVERVYDLPGRLNESQFARFHFDIGRMWNDDLPAMIYIRSSAADAEQSQFFADQLRSQWQIESAPGADDGLVILVTIRDRFPHTAIMSLSYGANSFPLGQMTVAVLNEVIEEDVTPRIRIGNVNGGLTYAVRRILYYAEYTAPFPPPLTDRQSMTHRLALPVNSLLTLVLIGLIAVPTRRFPSYARKRFVAIAVALSILVASAVIAISGRNSAASALAIAGIPLLLGLLWKLNRSSRTSNSIRPIFVTAPSARKTRRSRLARSTRRA